jgi:hypothetical protein
MAAIALRSKIHEICTFRKGVVVTTCFSFTNHRADFVDFATQRNGGCSREKDLLENFVM